MSNENNHRWDEQHEKTEENCEIKIKNLPSVTFISGNYSAVPTKRGKKADDPQSPTEENCPLCCSFGHRIMVKYWEEYYTKAVH